MDLIEIIATIAILAVGSLLTGGKKKAERQQAAPQRQTTAKAAPLNEAVPSQGAKAEKKQRKARQPEYFSYENQTAWQNVQEPSVEPQVQMDVENEVENGSPREWFDLRQAVIYQAIMKNKYIAGEIN